MIALSNRPAPAAANDLQFNRPPTLAWTPDETAASLRAVFDYATKVAEENIDWYWQKKRRKQFWAVTLRLLAILAGTVAGLVPILSQIGDGGQWSIAPGWASVALLVAAGMVAIDRFYGHSSAWIRYVATGLQLRSALHEFHLAWQIRLVAIAGDPQPKDIAEALEACRAFVVEIDKVVQKETAAWIAEFSTALKEIEASAQQHAAPRLAEPGKHK